METILKIWERRAALPGNANPLAEFRNIAKVVAAMKPESNPFKYLIRGTSQSVEQYATTLFDIFSRLIIALLFVNSTYKRKSQKVAAVAVNALSRSEQQVFFAFRQWIELFDLGPN